MGRHSSLASSSYISRSDADPEDGDMDLEWPFGRIDSIDGGDLRETAYELFFMSCRSSPGFGGAAMASRTTRRRSGGAGAGGKTWQQGLVATSRIKRALGLTARRSSPKRTLQQSSSSVGPSQTGAPGGAARVIKRPMTSAEIMRQQMRVTEQSDNRLRKTLLRTLVGQTGRRAETIILPLELLRQLKPSEFNDGQEYHLWQRRQLKLLEAGLLMHPRSPWSDEGHRHEQELRGHARAVQLRARLGVAKPRRRRAGGMPLGRRVPLNVHIYLSLLQSIFDTKEETVVLDEVDELLELMKKTWSTLGINRPIHNVCFAWVEQELLCAALSMLGEVASDAKRFDREAVYVSLLSATLASVQGWADKRLLDYRGYFEKGSWGLMENVILLALSVAKIIDEDISGAAAGAPPANGEHATPYDSSEYRVDYYIRSSLRNAFNKMLEDNGNWISLAGEVAEKTSQCLVVLAGETEELAVREKEHFSPVLKRWHPVPAAVAVVTLHNCYGVVLKQYMEEVSTLTLESIKVLQAAGKLEKALAQLAVEDSAECEDGGKGIVREMIPYEVDAIISCLARNWIEERLNCGKECLNRAKDTETWNPKTKGEAHAHSGVEMVKLARDMVDDFFDTPVGFRDDMVQYLADGLGSLLEDYTAFVVSCGTRQSYIPALPALTRCNQDSKFVKLWRKATPCNAGTDDANAKNGLADGDHPRPSTSRGTQRLYVRLNTLHYLLCQLHYLDKTLSHISAGVGGATPPAHLRLKTRRRRPSSSLFDGVRAAIQSAMQRVAEVAACRLIFLDSNSCFYEGLYVGDVANARIRPALRNLKQNLALISSAVTDRAQPLVLREVMKATFEAFLMVLLAGEMIADDFGRLKRVFAACGEGLVAEEVVQREAEVAEGVVALMGLPTDQLRDGGARKGLAAAADAPTTGKWNRSDANTILRVLCHRDDDASNRFLKRTFQMAKRK
ncbi:unnamed protein product [Spirodela intermedia]|uniref:Uncharacterized protein n=1 Tax=Spirodela intermedia TaxID=51605 RepID=A0A7I8IC19_SPIIN|nr:unnamed protein product [Spirodela intermedia]CAA6655327.1 unnamed protein product [Spirodela intermedia]